MEQLQQLQAEKSSRELKGLFDSDDDEPDTKSAPVDEQVVVMSQFGGPKHVIFPSTMSLLAYRTRMVKEKVTVFYFKTEEFQDGRKSKFAKGFWEPLMAYFVKASKDPDFVEACKLAIAFIRKGNKVAATSKATAGTDIDAPLEPPGLTEAQEAWVAAHLDNRAGTDGIYETEEGAPIDVVGGAGRKQSSSSSSSSSSSGAGAPSKKKPRSQSQKAAPAAAAAAQKGGGAGGGGGRGGGGGGERPKKKPRRNGTDEGGGGSSSSSSSSSSTKDGGGKAKGSSSGKQRGSNKGGGGGAGAAAKSGKKIYVNGTFALPRLTARKSVGGKAPPRPVPSSSSGR